MMRTLGQYMVGSAATFGYVQRVRRHSKFSFLTILQLLHVHWHDHPHRELAHPYRSFRQGSGEPRRPSHHEEEEGTDDAADPGSVDGNMKNGGHVQKTKLGLEVASPRRRMYYTERNFKPITSIMGKSLSCLRGNTCFFVHLNGSRFEFPGVFLNSAALDMLTLGRTAIHCTHSGISAMLLRRRSLPRGADRPAYEFRILQLRPAALGMTQHRKTKRSGASCNDFGPIEHA
jgi:hypothetical protein